MREEYSTMPRFHSVWFFLIEQREIAIATDVYGDGRHALSLIPALPLIPLAPLDVGLMSTAVMANVFLVFH